jgi:hypothetical protein
MRAPAIQIPLSLNYAVPMHRRFQAIGCLIVIVIVAATLIFGNFRSDNTTNTILAAHKACEAQTGHPCD